MAQHEGLALVLDAMDYRESSSLVRVLTEAEGRISLIARGLRKPKVGSTAGTAAIQPFNVVRLRYYIKEGQTLGNMGTAEIERAWSAPRASLETYSLAGYWFEILRESSQPRESTAAVFRLTMDFLESQEARPGLRKTFLRQLMELCALLGFGIALNVCSTCGKQCDAAEQFSIKTGLICHECAARGREGIMLKDSERELIHGLSSDDDGEHTSVGTLLDVLGLVNRFLVYHLEHPLKSFEFVQSTFG